MVRKERAVDGSSWTFRLYQVDQCSRPKRCQRGCFKERERERKKKEIPIVVFNLALNCLHLINRAQWTTTVGFAAAKDCHDHRCTSVMGGHGPRPPWISSRPLPRDSRTVEMHPLVLCNSVRDTIGTDFFFDQETQIKKKGAKAG